MPKRSQASATRPPAARRPTAPARTQRRARGARAPIPDAHLGAIFEHAATGIAIAGLDVRLQRCNPAFCALLGYSEAELLGVDFGALVHPDDREANLEAARRLVAGEVSSFVAENRYLHKDGRAVWVRKYVSTLPDERGCPSHIVALVTDLGPQREAERWLESFLENGPIVAWMKDEAGRYTFVSRSLVERLGPRFADAKGKTDLDLFDADVAEPFRRHDREVLDGGRAVELVEHSVAPDGSRTTWITGKFPFTAESGERFVGGLAVDVTARVKAEEDRQQFVSLVENSQDFIGLADLEHRPYFINAAGLRMVGLESLAEARRTSVWDQLFPEDRASVRARVDADLRRQGHADLEVRFRHFRTGAALWMHAAVLLVRDSDGRPTGIATVSRDVTERKLAEHKLRERKARLRATLDAASDAIVTIDRRGVIDSVNPATERLFGYTPAELVGRDVSVLMAQPEGLGGAATLARALGNAADGTSWRGGPREVAGRRRDGTVVPLALTTSAIPEHDLFVGNLHDLTRQKELESEVIEIAALEQSRIGQELHDDLGQQVTGAVLLADALAQRLADGPEHELAAQVVEVLTRLQTGMRSLAHGLVQTLVEPETLIEEVGRLAARAQELASIPCRFVHDEAVRVSDCIVATRLHRIAQEAIHNAVRHGRPSAVEVSLVEDERGVVLTVSDDGRGLAREPKAAGGSGLGLRLMRHRAELMGAELTVEPGAGGGTRVRCVVPRAARDA